MEVPMDEDQRRSSLGRIDYRAMTAQQTGEVPSVYDPPGHVQPGSRGYVSQQGQLTPRPVQLGPSPSQQAPSQSAPLPSVQNGQMGQQPLDNAVLHQTLHLLQQQLKQQQQLISQMLQQQQTAPPAQLQPAQQYQPAGPSNPELILDALPNSIAEFRYEAESGVSFEAWFTRYEDLFAKDASRLGDEAKVRLLVRKLGTPEHARYISYILPRSPRDLSFEETVDKLTALFGCRESLLSKRYRCLQICKKRTEDLIAFSCRVNRACVEFQFASMNEETFKCLMLVCGLKDDNDLRTRLLARIEERNDVTLEQLSAECQRITSVKGDSAMIAGETNERVFAVHSGEKRSHEKAAQQTNYKRFTPYRTKRPFRAKYAVCSSTSKPAKPCWLCGDMHWVRECTYRSHKCLDCARYGHREGHCNTASRKKRFNVRQRNINTRVVMVNVQSIRERRRFVSIALNGTAVRLQLDTASDISVIDRRTWRKIGSPPLTPSSVTAKTASGATLVLDGEFSCAVSVGSQTRQATLSVCGAANLLLLGADLIDVFSLWSVPMDAFCNHVTVAGQQSFQQLFPKVFTGIGLCTKASIKFTLRDNVRPVFRPSRPVAYAMEETVSRELDRLEELNVITPVTTAEWAAPVVVVRKANGLVRICGDYSTGLNAALFPHDYPLPVPEDIFARLANCKVFSKIDLSDAFLQVEIDPEYRHFLTINTHRGLYTYNRLPPGIKIAPTAFQQLMDIMLSGIQGVSVYLDDIIIGGPSEAEHDATVVEVLNRIQNYGFTLRAEKCHFRVNQIKYLGHIIDSHGLRPDAQKVEAIRKLPEPTNLTEVRSFLGAINYYGRFVPNMRNLRYPLDDLLKAGVEFRWTSECRKAFESFKTILASDLLLTHYDPKQAIIVSADASSVGLGATISHKYPDGSIRVVQHASRALTAAEKAYSQIDREGLAIIFAIKKFHKMIFGRKFLLQTDHRPLLRIFGSKKGIPNFTANRLQRFALTLLAYDFEIEYVRTDQFGNADLLSRLIHTHAKPDEDSVIACVTLEAEVKSLVTSAIQHVPVNFIDISRETIADRLLSKVLQYVQHGWPNNAAYEGELSRFHDRKDSITAIDGCLLFRERVVIPKVLQRTCLKQIAAKSPTHIKSTSWPEAPGPWYRIHVDYAGPLNGEWYLVIVDSFSKWPEVIPTSSTTTTATISILRNIFARFGNPVTLVSDNGPQFTSRDFESFCRQNGVEHIRTAPYHPQSNGLAESSGHLLADLSGHPERSAE
uniref:uncharacterized protein K02A2.6-like n=1 Tax=Anopheles coluzzii TaxID=1518534 RepID=UPI0020FFE982|nr:uncharacterized protein K02A2.6-like [Anopheles coluzzii]